jgi:hypothetical protein
MINMFNEKIYLFIWFWFLFVAISTVINFVYCLVTMVPASAREHRAAQLLRATKFDDLTDSADDRRIIRRFVHNGLRPDGKFWKQLQFRDLNSDLHPNDLKIWVILENLTTNSNSFDRGFVYIFLFSKNFGHQQPLVNLGKWDCYAKFGSMLKGEGTPMENNLSSFQNI